MLNPYNYFAFAEASTFHFITENNITYSIYLLDYSAEFGINENDCKLIFIGFGPVNYTAAIPSDLRVGETLVQFMLDYLEQHKNILFYFSSAQNGQEFARTRKFNAWFDKHKPENIKRQRRIIGVQESYFVYRADNELSVQIFDSIDSILKA